jgi:acetyl-CoA C-acetyltransferase
MKKVVVADAIRTPIGSVPGSLSSFSDTQLLAYCFSQMKQRVPIDWLKVSAVFSGCSFPKEKDNLSRKAALAAGLPESIPASTVNKTCASALEAMFHAIARIASFDAPAVLVGGVESMSFSSYSLGFFKKRVKDMMSGNLPELNDLSERYDENEMPVISEIVAKRYGIFRSEQDSFAAESRERAVNAYKNGYFDDEILDMRGLVGGELEKKDDAVSKVIAAEAYGKEVSFFVKDGCVTRYNSAPIGDAAAALLLMSEDFAKENNIKPVAEIAGVADVGVTGSQFGQGAVEAVRSVIGKCGLRVEDIDLFECNEAFSAEMILFMKMIGASRESINKNGGSIALGYPVGCEGLRLCVTQLHTMKRDKSRLGVCTTSAGALMGQAVLFRNCECVF